MNKDVYYLKDSTGCIVSSFAVEKATHASVNGKCHIINSWTSDGEPVNGEFFADVYCKWDSCTHWNFCGEDFDADCPDELIDAYYHLCGSHSFLNHVRAMCFVWKLVADIMAELSKLPDDPYDPRIIEEYFDSDDIADLCDLMLKGYTIEKEGE